MSFELLSVSPLIESQIPAFIRDSCPNFTSFLQAYYDWLFLNGPEVYSGMILGSTYNSIIIDPSNASTLTNYYVSMNVFVNNGPSKGYVRAIQSYDPVTGIIMVDPWDLNYIPPANTTISIRDTINPGKLSLYRDIDRTLNIFDSHFGNQFLPSLAYSNTDQSSIIVKHIKSLYQSKGTEEAIRILMRILFNEEVTIYYPKVDLFRPSDALWQTEYVMRLSVADISNWGNRKIVGLNSGVTATIESVSQFKVADMVVTELHLSNIDGDFSYTSGNEFGENVQISYLFIPPPQSQFGSLTDLLQPSTITQSGETYSVLASCEIQNGGDNYQIGDVITISGLGAFLSAQAVVSSIKLEYFTGRATILGGLTSSQIGLGSNQTFSTNYFVGDQITLTKGTGEGQIRTISAFNNSTNVVTVSETFSPIPDTTTYYCIQRNKGPITGISIIDAGLGFNRVPSH